MQEAENGGWFLTDSEMTELGQAPTAEIAAQEYAPPTAAVDPGTTHGTPPALAAAMLVKTTYPLYARSNVPTQPSEEIVWAGQ